jgi:predicted CoA-binding protein
MTEDEIRSLLEHAKTVAVVGASTDPEKAAHRVPALLLDAGFTVIPVHPKATEILGQQAYPSLAHVPVPVDIVDVFRPAKEASDIGRQAAEIGAGALWLQLGLSSTKARRIAEQARMAYVEDRCIGATTRQFGIRKERTPIR